MKGTRLFALVVMVVVLLVAVPMAIYAGTEDDIDGAWPTWITRKWTVGTSSLFINYQWGSNLGSPDYLWRKGFQSGINAWNAASTKVLFLQGTSNRSTLNTYFTDDGYAGKTVATLDSNQYLVSCDVLGNTTTATSLGYVQADYINTGAHELGHCIGLGHHPSFTTLMYPYHDPTISAPTQADIDGVNQMYP